MLGKEAVTASMRAAKDRYLDTMHTLQLKKEEHRELKR